ncbi:hypothetical protein [Oleiharenicola lentus]|uniref:hypothetical protein n=1 Tax=Oleiharenicola lentus TaxID=2508720 RepID=UPI003F669529
MITLLPFAAGIFAAAYFYAPNTADSLASDLPRTLFYLGNSDLGALDPSGSWQNRFLSNHNFVQLFILHHGVPLQCLNFFNVLLWIAAGVAVYLLARVGGATADAALIAGWLALVLTPVIAQAPATTSELPAGVAFLCSVLFAQRWLRAKKKRDAIFAGIAILLGLDGLRKLVTKNFIPAEFPHKAAELNTDSAAFGPSGLIVLACAIICIIRWRKLAAITSLCALIGIAWIAVGLIFHEGERLNPGIFVPAALIMSPCVAAVVAASWPTRRLLVGTGLIVVILATGLSALNYILDNTRRPLRPILTSAPFPAAFPPLPSALAGAISKEAWINFDGDGAHEVLLPLRILKLNQRFSIAKIPDPNAYTLLSRPSAAYQTNLRNLAAQSYCTLLAIPDKATAGVTFLATHGQGKRARDYFGHIPNSFNSPATAASQFIFITLTRNPSPENRDSALLQLTGLNLEDRCSLSVQEETSDGRTLILANLIEDGAVPIDLSATASRIVLKVVSTTSDKEIARAAITDEPTVAVNRPASTTLDSNSQFASDLVLDHDSSDITSDGLLPVEGPFPFGDRSYVRRASKTSVKLTVKPLADASHLRLSFSVRFHDRKIAGLKILFNGEVVKEYRLEGDDSWLNESLEFTPRSGTNVIEFRDQVLTSEPNWLEYVERYPDVKKYLLSNNIPLEAGARDHYKFSGQPEGRKINLRPIPRPSDSCYFMFRHIKLEGYQEP